jgi:hypothetical protein
MFGRSHQPGQGSRSRLTVLNVAPEPSDPVLGHVLPTDSGELGEQIERSYANLLDTAVGTVPDDVPVTSLLSLDARAELEVGSRRSRSAASTRCSRVSTSRGCHSR